MGVYIPNMEKPKDSCWDCKAQYNSVCSIKREHIRWDGILDDCPLIEIDLVRCGECKWSKTYYVRADNSTRLCCDNYSGLDKDVDPSDFCPYGERRTDEN